MKLSALVLYDPGNCTQKVSLAHLKRMQEVLKSRSCDSVNQLGIK